MRPFFYLVADLYFDFRQVHVDGEEFLAVVDDDATAFVKEVFGENDSAGVGGFDEATFVYGEVSASVSAGLFLVEDAGLAEGVGGLADDGGLEITGPLGSGAEVGVGVGFREVVGCDLLFAGGVGLDEVLRHVYAAGLECGSSDVDLLDGMGDVAGGESGRNDEIVGAGICFKVGTCEGGPDPGVSAFEKHYRFAKPGGGDMSGSVLKFGGKESDRTLLEFVRLPKYVLDGWVCSGWFGGMSCAMGSLRRGCCVEQNGYVEQRYS